ncbi:hypothetical protein, partial [Citrobacter freundii]|uniref:hypothetical protein n=2 Tax=Citrobacter freundii TaxID=546 RepID=UPI00311AB316
KTYSRLSTTDDRLRFCFANRNATTEDTTLKKFLLCALAQLPTLTNAGQITLVLGDEQETDNAKICVYSNANYTETVTIRLSEQCKYTRTFEED